MTETPTQRILIVGPSWVGDMVMAQPLFRLLKSKHPNSEIHVLAPAWTRPLSARMPEISGSIDMPIGHGKLLIGERYKLGRSLRDKFDQAIVLPNSLKSALIPVFAKIPLRTGWRGEMRFALLNDIRLLNKSKYPLMVERFLALALPVGAELPSPLPRPKLTIDQHRLPELTNKMGLSRDKPVLALCPGAEFGAAKRWPEQHYADVAKQKISQGWQVWVMGSAKDREVGENIRQHLGEEYGSDCVNLAGSTELAEAIDILSMADAVISNDSGLMHIAAALDKPLVAVYGSTSPGFTPPLSEAVSIESIAVECGPCFKRECPLEHLKCLTNLSPQQVLQGLDKALAIAQGRARTIDVQELNSTV